MSKAYLFPGQGAQFVGMGKERFEKSTLVKKLFDNANDILEFSLSDIIFNGPDEILKQTEYTQPAIFLHSIAAFRDELPAPPSMAAGHSLGEFSALVSAEVLTFEEGLRIVRKRGVLMQRAGITHPGAMAAIIGMNDEKVDQICKEASDKTSLIVVPANYNSPGQIVISGHDEAVGEAIILFQKAGCRIAKRLPVSGAFHSPLMESAKEGLVEELDKAHFNDALYPVYSNATAQPEVKGDQLKKNVIEQLLNPVRWTQTIQNMNANGADTFIEFGPGKVLQGLVKRTLKQAEIDGFQ